MIDQNMQEATERTIQHIFNSVKTAVENRAHEAAVVVERLAGLEGVSPKWHVPGGLSTLTAEYLITRDIIDRAENWEVMYYPEIIIARLNLSRVMLRNADLLGAPRSDREKLQRDGAKEIAVG
ncbi:hypothetical protein AAG570_009006 [Ranatra chinensis]|uniref:Uncharacterized protein n=1 Tax=Ranatra chinensis TaxID=642074 RepID=A0ABD0ZFW1_9HEMI